MLIQAEVLMVFKKEKHTINYWNGKNYIQKNMLSCWKAQGGLASRPLRRPFAKNEYRSYILIDFSKATNNILECFNDIGNLNIFFLRLQAETGITLYEHDSLIIF